MRVAIADKPFSADSMLAQFADSRTGAAGALASFVGYCRDVSDAGDVHQLQLDHYPGLTEAEITRLANTIIERHGLIDLLVVHRVGVVTPNEPIVLVAALSSHRAQAFAAVAELMDYLKTDAPFWKREAGSGGERWIEPTDADRARRAALGE
ncbi:MAG: molybdenum cofactor biosynthesis protein MoaE [Proteobacteria bacterium]|nr:molybdenum cofactor biosynthesis protein MoaE [Pseudomonadota bacterium]